MANPLRKPLTLAGRDLSTNLLFLDEESMEPPRSAAALRSELERHAKLATRDMKAGRMSRNFERAGDFVASTPDAVILALELAWEQEARGRPNQLLLDAYFILLSRGLEAFAMGKALGDRHAARCLAAVRDRVAALVAEDAMSGPFALGLMWAFKEADLEPGEPLTSFVHDALEAAGQVAPSLDDILAAVEKVAVDADGDPFLTIELIDDQISVLPPEARRRLYTSTMQSRNPTIREAMVLLLLDGDRELRSAICRQLAETASPATISPASLRRMVAIRDWWPDEAQPTLDAAIAKARATGVAGTELRQARTVSFAASPIDGGGSQAIFAYVKNGRAYDVASVHLKEGHGVVDAVQWSDLSKAVVDKMRKEFAAQVAVAPVSSAYLDLVIPHYLAVGRRDGGVPVRGLLALSEMLGAHWHPRIVSGGDLLAMMEADAAALLRESDAVEAALRRSEQWTDEFPVMEGWFEEDAEIGEILDEEEDSDQWIDAVLTSVFERHREAWADRFLWTALRLKEQQDVPQAWSDLWVVAREIRAGRPLGEIPIMTIIAEESVEEAFSDEPFE